MDQTNGLNGNGPKQELLFEFDNLQHHFKLLDKLNTLRKNRHFCDVTLQVGTHPDVTEVHAHRAVLAAASSHFLEVFTSEASDQSPVTMNGSTVITNKKGSVTYSSINTPIYKLPCTSVELPCVLALIDYSYTGRLHVEPDQVRFLYTVACRLRMSDVASKAARHLEASLNTNTCLALRATAGVRQDPPLLCAVDAFIRQNADTILHGAPAQRLPRIRLDLLHSGRKPAQCVNRSRLFELALQWMRPHLQRVATEKKDVRMSALTSRVFMLYLDQEDLRLHDCMQLRQDDIQFSEAVHEYQCAGSRDCALGAACVTRNVPIEVAGQVSDYDSSESGSTSTGLNNVGTETPENLLTDTQNSSQTASGRSQDLHPLLDAEEERAHLPNLNELEEQWALQRAKETGEKYCTSTVEKRDSGDQGVKQYMLTRSDSNSSLSSAPEEDEGDWKILATDCLSKHMLIGLVMAAGRLCMLHIRLQSTKDKNGVGETDVNNLDTASHVEEIKQMEQKEKKEKPKYISIAPMSRGRCALGAAAFGKSLLICGGYDRSECLKTVELYDVDKNSWTSLPNMSVPRGRFNITVLGEQVFAIGGSDGHKELSSAEKFINGNWQSIANGPIERSNPGVCSMNGKIYVIGGWNGQRGMQRCDLYDPETDSWSRIADLNIGRAQVAVCELNNEIYAVGGTDAWACLSSVEKLEKNTGRWKMMKSLQIARRGCGLVTFQGKLCAIGGHDGVNSLSSTEIHEESEDTWKKGPSLSVGRANVAVAVVGDRLFAVGGFSGKHFLHSMEYLNKLDGEWNGFVLGQPDKTHASGTNTSSLD